ncbi:MAG: putative 1,4-beta-N-acetylmuramidase [Frankiales bacterium]|nr:putative 1,4-beta-N-acetylmuramidase [Frankiales bacterium]
MRARALLPLLLAVLSVLVVPATPSTAASSSLTGPDVAKYQHPNGAAIDWNAVRRDGRRFAFVKATQSTNYTNAYFASDWHGIAAAGLFRGAYHYANPSGTAGSAKSQADYFASTIGNQSGSGTLPPVLDLEDAGGLSVSALRTWVSTFLTELRARTGRVPMLYTYPSFWRNSMGSSTAFTSYPLWIANYNATAPQDIGWSRYTFWQYTSTATVGGITGNTDLSTFSGTSTDLSALALAGSWKPATQTVSEQPAGSTSSTCGGFAALPPQRVLDTRSNGSGPVGGSVTFTLPSSVPADAVGVQLDVTAVEAKGAGYLRVGPTGTAPTTTALTYGAGRSTTGLVTTTADGTRQVTVTVYGTAVDLVVDVVGSYGPTGGAQWYAAPPGRVADTRTGQGLPAGKLSGTADLNLSSVVPSTATGLVLDVSAVAPGGAGFVRLAAAGTTPTTTALNYDAAGSTTGLAVTSTGNGHVTVSVNGAPTHLVVDLLGWFDTSISAGGQYCPLTPTRFLDTRTGLGATGPGTGPLGLSTPATVPNTAAAVVLDVSAVNPSGSGFVRVTTTGQEPITTALNTIRNRSVTGLVVVPLNEAQLVLAAYQANTQLVADVVGYLGSPPTG